MKSVILLLVLNIPLVLLAESDMERRYNHNYELNMKKTAIEVEAFASKIKTAILGDNWEYVFKNCDFPLYLKGKKLTFKEAMLALSAEEKQLIKNAIKDHPTDNLFCNSMGCLFGHGFLWFQNVAFKGELKITAINLEAL